MFYLIIKLYKGYPALLDKDILKITYLTMVNISGNSKHIDKEFGSFGQWLYNLDPTLTQNKCRKGTLKSKVYLGSVLSFIKQV